MATTMMHGMAAVANDSGFNDDAVAFALKNLGLCRVFEEGAIFGYQSNII